MQLNIRGIEVNLREDQVVRLVTQHFTGKDQINSQGIQFTNLNDGEHYAGIILGKNGEPSYRLVLLPGEVDEANWQKSMDWAKSIGGELPNRREQTLLYANLKEEFRSEYYWSNEPLAEDAAYAWAQYFGNGYQTNWHKGLDNRARAVRRLII